jgi:hypothetical protein
MDRFIEEAQRLTGKDILIADGTRFIILKYKSGNFEYIFARIEKGTGDIYSASGKTPKGNIYASPYGGIDVINERGVIVNKQKLARRLNELRQS